MKKKLVIFLSLTQGLRRANKSQDEQFLNSMDTILAKIQTYLPPLDTQAKTMIINAFDNGPAYREDLLIRALDNWNRTIYESYSSSISSGR